MGTDRSIRELATLSVGLVVVALVYSLFIGNVLMSLFVAGIVLMAWWVYLFARLVFAVERYVDR